MTDRETASRSGDEVEESALSEAPSNPGKPKTALQWARHFLTYGFGVMSLAALSFLLVPIYTRRILPGDYGVLELLNRGQDILGLAVMSGMGAAALAFFQFEAGNASRKRKVFSTAILGILANGFLLCAVLLPMAERISQSFFHTAEYIWAVRIFTILIPLEVSFQLGLVSLQADFKSGAYVGLTLARFALGLSVNLIVVFWLRWGLNGILLATLIHTGLPALFIILFIFRQSKWGFEWKLWKEMARFGLPFLPGGLFLFVLNSGDRYFLNLFHGAEAVGVYAVSYKLGYVITFAVLAPFIKVWGPVMVDVGRKPEGAAQIARVTTHLCTAYMYCAVCFCLVASFMIRKLVGPAYLGAIAALPVVVLAYFFWALSVVADTVFYVTKKTDVKPIMLGAAGVVCLSLYALLIPPYGALGAAWATVAAFAFLAFLTLRVGQRYLPVPYEYGRICGLLGLGVGMYCGGRYFGDHYQIPELVIGLAAAALFPSILWVLHFWNAGEKLWITTSFARAQKKIFAS